MAKDIAIKGARENNLKGLDVTIPRDKFVVLTGLSGSGKSSLAFDTIYAEGQRKYMESLSSYARQFLGQMEKPNVESIEGLSPAISIDQKTTNQNPRSTVGTVTEIYDYLRLMYARIGIPHCPVCGREISSQSVDQIVETLMQEPEGSRLTVMAPVIRQRKGQHEKILDRIRREGFTRACIDGEMKLLEEDEITLEKNFKHTIEIVVDRIKVRDGVRSRLSEACELAIGNGDGLVQVEIADPEGARKEKTFSTSLACPEHGVSIDELEPRMFSFNNPLGACPECKGLGFIQSVDADLLIPDQSISIMDKALGNAFATMEFTSYYWQVIRALADKYGADVTLPFKKLPKKFRQVLLYGTGEEKLVYDYTNRAGMVQHRSHTYEGLIPNLERRYQETNSEWIKNKIETYMNIAACPTCHGTGKEIKDPCVKCRGEGRTKTSKTVEVNIPAGIDDGQRIRLSGEGEPGTHGAPAGDLYVNVRVKEHKIFERNGLDLHCELPISFAVAALGGEVEVPTLDGKVKLSIPKETQTGRRMRVKGKGIKSLRSSATGDLYCHVLVETPVNLTDRQKELLEEFEKISTGLDRSQTPRKKSFWDKVGDLFD